jgi:xanthine/uracil permease
MSFIHEYPLWAERTVWALRVFGYAFAANTGAAALIYTPLSLKADQYIIVGTMLVFGIICMVSALMKRYIIEWIALFFLTGGVSTYVCAVWVSTLTTRTSIAGASVFTFLVLLMLVRVIDLTVYWRRNVQAAKLQAVIDGDA